LNSGSAAGRCGRELEMIGGGLQQSATDRNGPGARGALPSGSGSGDGFTGRFGPGIDRRLRQHVIVERDRLALAPAWRCGRGAFSVIEPQ